MAFVPLSQFARAEFHANNVEQRNWQHAFDTQKFTTMFICIGTHAILRPFNCSYASISGFALVPYAAISVWSFHLFSACVSVCECLHYLYYLYKRDALFPFGSINYSKYPRSGACFGQCWLFHRQRVVWSALDSGQYFYRCVRITMENEDICSCLDLNYSEIAVVCARQITSLQLLLFLIA